MADLLVDTDVFVDHLRGHRALAVSGGRVFYSAITRAELFAGRRAQEAPVRLLLAPFTELVVDRSIAERGGRLRRETGISLGDCLIAATALQRDLILVTRNLKDFGSIPGLQTRNPG